MPPLSSISFETQKNAYLARMPEFGSRANTNPGFNSPVHNLRFSRFDNFFLVVSYFGPWFNHQTAEILYRIPDFNLNPLLSKFEYFSYEGTFWEKDEKTRILFFLFKKKVIFHFKCGTLIILFSNFQHYFSRWVLVMALKVWSH